MWKYVAERREISTSLRAAARSVFAVLGTRNVPFCGILLLAVLVRLFHLTVPPCDYHNWRQTITLMVARDFSRNGFALFHPHLLWLGKGDRPAYFAAEFSLESIAAAILYRIFGENEMLPRLVVILFSTFGIWFLYAIVRKYCGRLAGCLAALIYAFFPAHIYFGRVFMPDVPALSLALAGLYFADRWTEAGEAKYLMATGLATCFAILQKISVAFVLLPILFIFLRRHGKSAILRTGIWLFAFIVFVPVVLWYWHAWTLSLSNGFEIMQPRAVGANLKLWLNRGFLLETGRALYEEAFSPVGFVICAFGLFWPSRSQIVDLFRIWFLGAGLLVFLTPQLVRGNHYYLLGLLPAGAALGGIALAQLVRGSPHRLPILVLIFTFFGLSVLSSVAPMYLLDLYPWQLGLWLRKTTAPADLIVTENGGSPGILYYADRHGWFLEKDFDAGLIGRFRDRGAAWYADSNPHDAEEYPAFVAGMDERFHRVHPQPRPWLVYRLR